MRSWYRDLNSGRLVKTNPNTVYIDLSESQAHTVSTMAENESVHDEHENHPLRTMREYLQPPRNSSPSCFIFPLNANNFRFKPGMISLLPNFHGLESESPYLHLKEFEEVCIAFNDQNCTEEIVKLKLFPFSLKDKAKTWLNSLKPRSIGTWQEMQGEFLKKFFPIHKTNALKRQIQNFSQNSNEAYFQSWERFKDLLNSCPHHGFEKWRTISFFYEGLTPETKQFVETMCNGEFLDKEPDEALDYLSQLAENSQSWHGTNSSENSIRANLASANKGKYHLSQEEDVNARFASLARKIEAMELGKVKEIKSVQNEEICNICDELGHSTNECPKIPAFKEVVHEQVNTMNNFKMPFTSSFSDSYNSGWRNHPNFNWRNNNQAQFMQPPPPQAQQGYQNSQGYVPYVSSYWQNLEETLHAFMEKQEAINNQNTQAMIDIKDTLAKLSSALIIHEKEKFSSQPQPNPKEVEVTKSPVKPEDDDEGHQIFMIDSIMDKGTSITHEFDPSEKFLIKSEFDSISNPYDEIDISTIFYGTQDHDTQAWQSKCKEFLKKAWSITDKKGVRPLVTSHKINLEEGKWSAVEAIT